MRKFSKLLVMLVGLVGLLGLNAMPAVAYSTNPSLHFGGWQVVPGGDVSDADVTISIPYTFPNNDRVAFWTGVEGYGTNQALIQGGVAFDTSGACLLFYEIVPHTGAAWPIYVHSCYSGDSLYIHVRYYNGSASWHFIESGLGAFNQTFTSTGRTYDNANRGESMVEKVSTWPLQHYAFPANVNSAYFTAPRIYANAGGGWHYYTEISTRYLWWMCASTPPTCSNSNTSSTLSSTGGLDGYAGFYTYWWHSS